MQKWRLTVVLRVAWTLLRRIRGGSCREFKGTVVGGMLCGGREPVLLI